MSYTISEIEGIGEARSTKLAEAGITNTEQLLTHCGDAKGRAAVAEKTGFSAETLLKWANMADLMRVSGVGKEYSELLELGGVDTVKELGTRRADNLTAKLAEVNAAKNVVRSVPTEAVVTKWIEHARTLDPRITH